MSQPPQRSRQAQVRSNCCDARLQLPSANLPVYEQPRAPAMRVRQMNPDDFSSVATLLAEAFHEDILFAWLHPRRTEYPAQFRDSFLRTLKRRHYTPGTQSVVAETDETDVDCWNGKPEIAGYAAWERKGPSDAARKWQQDSSLNKLERLLLKGTDRYYELLGLDRSENLAAVRRFRATTSNVMEDVDDHWYLAWLGVSNRHRRRGVGRLLVGWGLDNAEEEGVPVWLTSSPVGEKLYEKMGFRGFGYTPIVDGELCPVFIWEPKGMEGKWGER
ncbi:MAG: hypothetical protein M1837_006970 [Sclerophora amabilis]|nr:MAG: hypothetical protein M1837_006970 [Sclerophora amabilis]